MCPGTPTAPTISHCPGSSHTGFLALLHMYCGHSAQGLGTYKGSLAFPQISTWPVPSPQNDHLSVHPLLFYTSNNILGIPVAHTLLYLSVQHAYHQFTHYLVYYFVVCLLLLECELLWGREFVSMAALAQGLGQHQV